MGQPVIHFEILGKDADKTQSYYSELFGWEIEALPFENPTQYGLVERDGNTNAEGIGIGGGVGGAPEGHPGHSGLKASEYSAPVLRALEWQPVHRCDSTWGPGRGASSKSGALPKAETYS